MKRVKVYRSFEDIVNKDFIYPQVGLGADPYESKRHFAVAEVLQRVPPSWYKKLIEHCDAFIWYIPHTLTYGETMPFSATVYPESNKSGLQEREYAQVVYLSPRLEDVSSDVTLAVVAHELAHLCLGHKLRCNNETYNIQEKAAWRLIREWGFEKEFKEYEQFSKKREEKLALNFP